jgi:hypothetical protein
VDRSDEQLREAAGVEGHTPGTRLIGEVGRHDDGQAQVATGQDERQVARDVAAVRHDQDRVGGHVQQQLPERIVAYGVVGQRPGPGQIHEDRLAPAREDPPLLERHGRARGVAGLGVATAGTAQEGRLAHVRATDQRDDRDIPLGGRRGGAVTGGHRRSAADRSTGSTSTRLATAWATATRARPTRTITGPRKGARLSGVTTVPVTSPSANSSSTSSAVIATTRHASSRRASVSAIQAAVPGGGVGVMAA